MKFLVVLVSVIAAVAAAGEKESKPFAFNSNPWNQGYYPGNLGYYPGYQGYAGHRGFYPGFHGHLGYQGNYGYPGYAGYQGFYPGYQGFNRGYYPGFQPTPTPISATAAPLPKVVPTPIAVAAYKPVDGRQPAILSQVQDVNLDGTFRYGFETENGISNQAQGYVKNAGTDAASQVVEGSYSYTADDGSPVEVRYYADETGYHASGNIVPTVPAEIARSLEFNAHEEASKISAIKK